MPETTVKSKPAAQEKKKSSANQFMMSRVFTPLAGIRFMDWLKLLSKHGLSITPGYWLRLLFTTFMSLLNSIFSKLELLAYKGQLKKFQKTNPIKAPVFVLGHHRSGTTHLLNLLACDERLIAPNVLQAVFPHTFLTAEKWIKPLASKVAMRKRPQDNVKFSVSEPIEEERAICAATFCSIQMARHFPKRLDAFRNFVTMRDASDTEKNKWKQAVSGFANKLFFNYFRVNGKSDQVLKDRHLLFKSPDHTGKIKLILEVFPDARFVHIHRDPFAVFRSTLNMEKKTDPLYQYHDFPDDQLEPFTLWRYKVMHEAFFEDSKDLPENQFMDIAFETLEVEPMQTIEKVYSQLELPDFEVVRPILTEYLESIKDYKKNTYKPLPKDQQARIVEAWGFCFERWGYKTEETN